MYFRGRSIRSLDTKGRLMLPPEFRDILISRSEGGQLVLTTLDGCVYGFPWPDWQEFEDKINRIKNPARAVRDFRRLVLGGAEVMAADGQGRIRLSRELMQYSGIDREAVLVGQGAHFELWSAERLAPALAQSFDDVTQAMTDSGIDFVF
ncbi:Protein MraZ [uncultured delta proteobacterium]|uniref:Transcriptional regulator MraZ n=1 Tax=uncultured delta proteobacterium TaxID=34034 RepID=A0A212JI65_9DELT|nr:Protein MraZ [uncultured delta proteobacterium]